MISKDIIKEKIRKVKQDIYKISGVRYEVLDNLEGIRILDDKINKVVDDFISSCGNKILVDRDKGIVVFHDDIKDDITKGSLEKIINFWRSFGNVIVHNDIEYTKYVVSFDTCTSLNNLKLYFISNVRRVVPAIPYDRTIMITTRDAPIILNLCLDGDKLYGIYINFVYSTYADDGLLKYVDLRIDLAIDNFSAKLLDVDEFRAIQHMIPKKYLYTIEQLLKVWGYSLVE